MRDLPDCSLSACWFAAVFLLATLLIAAAPASADTSATVDLTQPRQVVDGLGVNANVHSWEGGELRPAIEQIGAIGGRPGA